MCFLQLGLTAGVDVFLGKVISPGTGYNGVSGRSTGDERESYRYIGSPSRSCSEPGTEISDAAARRAGEGVQTRRTGPVAGQRAVGRERRFEATLTVFMAMA